MNDQSTMNLYAQTIFYWLSELDLSPPGEYPATFAIITAYNPQGKLCSDVINQGYDAHFRHYLRQHYHRGVELKSPLLPLYPIMGCSPDRTHRELSYLIEVDLASAYHIAEEFEQNAFFWVEHDHLTIVPVKLNTAHQSVGSFRQRLLPT